MADDEVFSPRSRAYLAAVQNCIADQAPRDIGDRIAALVADHDRWRLRCLNLNPAETLLSRRCRRLLDSDMATRLTEGLPGDKLYPHGVQNNHIDEIEAVAIALLRRLFGAAFVEWRPISVNMANAAVFFSLLDPGDVILSQAEDGGGNYSYHAHGAAGLARARVVPFPCNATFEIDLDRLDRLVERERPRMIVFGGSNVLFPYPVREMRRMADRVGALLVYDAAHLALLISAGEFQDPFEEGADIVTISTAKSIGGPIGGVVLTNSAEIARRIVRLTFPALIQTHDENKYSALAFALAEMAEFGPALARRKVANARALAAALESEGFTALAGARGYTATHQVFLDLGREAKLFETRCQEGNILVADCALAGNFAWTERTGIRLGTYELSRVGMDETDMAMIARLMRRAVRDREDPAIIAREVEELLGRYPVIVHSFDGQAAAP